MQKKITAALFLLTTFFVSCASLPNTKKIPIANTHHTIYFVVRKWHTSVVLEAQQLVVNKSILAAELHGEKFARIGWGDGDYFTGKSKTWGSATKALFVSQYSALQLLTYGDELLNEIPPETIVPLAISDEGLRQLIHFIDASVAVDEKKKTLKLHAYSADTGVFFQANDHYSIFNNCNTWSGYALKLTGLPVAGRLTAQGVFKQAQNISRVQAQVGLFQQL